MTDSPADDLAPRFADGSEMRVIGLAERYTDATRGAIPEQWRRFNEQRIGGPVPADSAAFGLVYPLDDGADFEYVTGIMVDENARTPDGFVERRLSPRRHAVFHNPDGLPGIQPLVHRIFRDWLPVSGAVPAGRPLLVEVYGEAFDPATGTGAIEIWVPLARAGESPSGSD